MTILVHSDVYSTQHNICWFFSDLRKLVVSPTPQIKLITIIKWKKKNTTLSEQFQNQTSES